MDERPPIKTKSRIVYHNMHNIKKISKHLSKSSIEKLIHGLVFSHLDYCNSLLFGLPKYQLHRLKKVQNFAARVISSINYYDHITPVLMNLHWLPVEYRIQYKIIMLVYKSVHGRAPSYLQAMCLIKQSSYNLRRSTCSDTSLVIPFIKHSTLGGRAFAHSGPVLWNSLPIALRESVSLEVFKAKLKTHLFKLAFL